jgi:hypothetical protein
MTGNNPITSVFTDTADFENPFTVGSTWEVHNIAHGTASGYEVVATEDRGSTVEIVFANGAKATFVK